MIAAQWRTIGIQLIETILILKFATPFLNLPISWKEVGASIIENDLCRKECVRKADFEDEFE